MEKNLEKYFLKENDFYNLSSVACQILLGVEFLHSKGVLHRDLKPQNILINIEDETPYAKICDFGIACFTSNYRPSTPGTVTGYYRAPEICCEYDNYSRPIDIWSVGCIFYEMFTKRVFIQTSKDSDEVIFQEIIKKSPEHFTTKFLSKYIRKGEIKSFRHNYNEELNSKKQTFKSKISSRIDVSRFEEDGLNIDHFSDLLQSLLYLEPQKRLTAREALEHPFFSSFTNFISDTREAYPPSPLEDQKIKIIDCMERRWAINIAFSLFNRRDDDLEWYNNHILFHSIRIFDEYLEHYYEKKRVRTEATMTQGKFLTKSETTLYFYTCVYISYKYFSALYSIYPWKEIFPRSITKDKENKQKVVNFENLIIKKICKYIFFRPTLLEYLDREEGIEKKRYEEKELDVKIFLYNYGNMEMSYEGTMEDLYLQIKKGRN